MAARLDRGENRRVRYTWDTSARYTYVDGTSARVLEEEDLGTMVR